MHRSWMIAVWAMLLLLLHSATAGCGSTRIDTITIDHRTPLPHRLSDQFSDCSGECPAAGFSKIDITPPPGIAMAGYSAMAGTGSGFRGRLYARAVYIRSRDGHSVALVQSDLLSGSLLLHHRVAERIAETTDVPARGLMVAGTHTHSAPGNYFGNNFYNNFASSQKGLNEDLYRFLASRMATAVETAYQNSRPAKIAAGSIPVHGRTRNRSLAAYAANPGVTEAVDPLQAVNPEFFMIRIDLRDDDGRYKPAGAFSSFSIHPTVVPYDNDLYTPDVFGYIAGELEYVREAVDDAPWPFVHAAVNGTHGDNSPDYAPGQQGYLEAKRLGKAVGREAISLFDALGKELKDDVPVLAACREVDLYQHPSIDGVSLCSRPVVGNALTAGAEDGRTPILRHLPFFREGWGTARWFFTGSCQGHKRHVGGFFQRLVLPKQDFPHHLFFQVIQIGDTVLLPFPFEVTFRAGEQIAAVVSRATAADGLKPVVISCANGYFGYATTAEEYSRQHYEGGHTLYGPETTLFLEKHVASLTADMKAGRLEDLPEQWSFRLKHRGGFPPDRAPRGRRSQVTAPQFFRASDNAESFWRFQWQDVPPARINFHQPLIYLETSKDGDFWQVLQKDGRVVDDRSLDMAVRFRQDFKKDQMGLYEGIWFDPQIPAGHLCRFVVRPRDGRDVLYSSVFSEKDQ